MARADNVIISHVRKEDNAIQSNGEHCDGVAEMARRFASAFGMGDFGCVLGLLHDKGKERKSFQEYIRVATGVAPGRWNGEDKQHAFVGAVLAQMEYPNMYQLVGYPIMGHHCGLRDYNDYADRVRQKVPAEISAGVQNIELRLPERLIRQIPDKETLKKDFHHIVRMLFSCLVDADYIDTEMFLQPDKGALRLQHDGGSFQNLKNRLDEYLNRLSSNAVKSTLNELRTRIQNRCRDMALSTTGFYSLTVPTGGGKTLSSLVWAINHGIKNNKKRIIIAIPYTSIVTQTAQILRSIFGYENVLEHHSNSNVDRVKDSNLKSTLLLATENWDYPIVVTTNVQLFESMMSNRPSKCRKLHNLADSILIMDEVQTLPIENLQPIVDSLQTYQRLFGMSILFTTASLPALKGNMKWGRGVNDELHGIEHITEIIPCEWKLYDKFRRVEFNFVADRMTHEDVARQLMIHRRVLCVVNTRNDARLIYEGLDKKSGVVLHLSRMMCSAHILQVIESIKRLLENPDNVEIRVVSTQLIEAGVDIDFPVVFRQEAGLDSLLQSAGRCNREGRQEIGQTYVFKLEKKPFGQIGRACDAKENLPSESDWFNPETMTDYFIQLYSRTETFDKSNIRHFLYSPDSMCFEKYAEQFKMIDETECVTVYVNYGNCASLIEELKTNGPDYMLMKKLSLYAVNIRQNDFAELQKNGLVDEIMDGIYYIADREQYREDVGLIMENHWLEEILTI